jgi:F-type H+-transporting ATPase subunit epsilon
MHVLVIAPDASKFDGEADSVIVPVYDGQVGILPNHAPFMAPLGRGVLTLRHEGRTTRFQVQGGFLQVVSNTVRIVAEHVEGVHAG